MHRMFKKLLWHHIQNNVSINHVQVHETRKAVRDSKTGIEKVEVGHRIGDRAHVISRSRNVRTGDAEENQEFENLDEGKAYKNLLYL